MALTDGTSRRYRIAAIPGDGIGREVLPQGVHSIPGGRGALRLRRAG